MYLSEDFFASIKLAGRLYSLFYYCDKLEIHFQKIGLIFAFLG